MVSLEMSGEDYDGIPAVADALTVDDMKALSAKAVNSPCR